MNTKKGFNLRTVCGENILVAEGEQNIDFSNIISMNESSSYLWRKAQEHENFTAEDMQKWLTEEYDVEDAVALADASALLQQWTEAGLIEN